MSDLEYTYSRNTELNGDPITPSGVHNTTVRTLGVVNVKRSSDLRKHEKISSNDGGDVDFVFSNNATLEI